MRFSSPERTSTLSSIAPRETAYTTSEWSGTISFWLSLDPAVDLEPGFCDPIQLTDSAYNDAAIWVDFIGENARQFRLGIFGDLSEWNPDELSPNDNPFFTDRLIAVDEPPFESGQWTHVAITFSGINTASGGTANLYLNGSARPKTMEGLNESFTWDASRGEVRLGINYVGLFDELSIFDRSLSAELSAARLVSSIGWRRALLHSTRSSVGRNQSSLQRRLAFNLEGESMLARFFVRRFDSKAVFSHRPFQFFINTKHLYGFDL